MTRPGNHLNAGRRREGGRRISSLKYSSPRTRRARRNFGADRPNQKWVGDTTELVTGNGKLFVAVILDLVSKYVVGWSLSPVNDRHLTLSALKRALVQRCPGLNLLHSSDQGSTYASEDYQDVLAAHRITCT